MKISYDELNYEVLKKYNLPFSNLNLRNNIKDEKKLMKSMETTMDFLVEKFNFEKKIKVKDNNLNKSQNMKIVKKSNCKI